MKRNAAPLREHGEADPVTLSPCHLVTLSPCHLVTLSPCHLVTLSPCHLVTLSPCHLVTLSPCHLCPANDNDPESPVGQENAMMTKEKQLQRILDGGLVAVVRSPDSD